MKVHSNKLDGVMVSPTAIKLIFEDNDDQINHQKAVVPLYRQLGNRQTNAVFKPKTLQESYDNFDLGAVA